MLLYYYDANKKKQKTTSWKCIRWSFVVFYWHTFHFSTCVWLRGTCAGILLLYYFLYREQNLFYRQKNCLVKQLKIYVCLVKCETVKCIKTKDEWNAWSIFNWNSLLSYRWQIKSYLHYQCHCFFGLSLTRLY